MDNEDKELFDSALDDNPVEQEAQVAEAQPEPEAQPRDEHGRFAPKSEYAPKGDTETVIATQSQPEPQKDEAHVPSWRLREVREEADRRIAEVEARWQRQIDDLRRQSQPKPEPTPVPDIFENPTGAIEYGVKQHVDPIRSELQQTRETFSRMLAEDKHGADKVQAAYSWIEQGMQRGEPEAIAAYQRAMRSLHPYQELVQAHQQRTVYQQIGNDPNAWFEKELERRMADPKFAASQLQRVQQSARVQGAQNPTINIPPSLNRVSGAAPVGVEDGDDNSDAGIFRFATR